jgi:hypothetical protein
MESTDVIEKRWGWYADKSKTLVTTHINDLDRCVKVMRVNIENYWVDDMSDHDSYFISIFRNIIDITYNKDFKHIAVDRSIPIESLLNDQLINLKNCIIVIDADIDDYRGPIANTPHPASAKGFIRIWNYIMDKIQEKEKIIKSIKHANNAAKAFDEINIAYKISDYNKLQHLALRIAVRGSEQVYKDAERVVETLLSASRIKYINY